MTTVTTVRLAGALVGAALLAASAGSAAEARIPEGAWESTAAVLDDAGVNPDVVGRAVARGPQTRLGAKTSASGAATPDWLERAALRAIRR